MIILDATDRKLTVELLESGALPCVAAWVDVGSSSFLAGSSRIQTNGTTTVDFVAAPAASTQRQIKSLNILNNSGSSKTVIVKFDDGGTEYSLAALVLPDDYLLQYQETYGWRVVDGSGVTLSGTGSLYQDGYDSGLAAFNHSGVTNLSVVLDGVTAECRYVASDWTLAEWGADGYGNDLEDAGSGTDPTYDPDKYFDDGVGAVTMNGGEIYKDSVGTSQCDPGTKDIVLEWVGTVNSSHSTNRRVAAKYPDTVDTVGWMLFVENTSVGVQFLIRSASTSVQFNIGIAPTFDALMHVMVFIDRNDVGRIYINGVKMAESNVSALDGVSITTSTPFALGAQSDNLYPMRGDIVLFQFWSNAAGWLSSGDWDDIAQDRYLKLISGRG